MAEVCRTQLWQWRHHRVEVADGTVLDDELLDAVIEEEFAALRATLSADQWAAGRYSDARDLLRELVVTPDFPEFLTIPAYARLLST